MKKKIVELYKNQKRLELLQYAYVMAFAATLIAAGLIALINQAVGVAILIVPLVCLIAAAMNLIAWSLVKSGIERFLSNELKKSTKK
ncbi:MAG: hypothetical protein Q4E70_02705 [Candidatus Saccharibacteria bacterium]|nr:hypothetical protein [Candidatus Saccharibacteria bacterium]MDO4967651.1 hypothetical protein [Candidatus Saccharibacteria bacterium]